MQTCEVCDIKIPDDYQNELCDVHYSEVVQEQEDTKKEAATEAAKDPQSATNGENLKKKEPVTGNGDDSKPPEATDGRSPADFGISDPNYQENPEMDDKQQILANLAQFIYSHGPKSKGKMLWYPQRNMYNYIKQYSMRRVTDHPQYPKYQWKPDIVDVGCGSGVGSNVMSQEANMVWGIDKNAWSIEFANECFRREKNGLYYSSQLTFDIIDVIKDNREFMKFDIVVAIEVIEHVYDTDRFLKSIIQFTKRNKRGDCHLEMPTEFFLSTPNRNSPKIRKDKPENIYHVREWTGQYHRHAQSLQSLLQYQIS